MESVHVRKAELLESFARLGILYQQKMHPM